MLRLNIHNIHGTSSWQRIYGFISFPRLLITLKILVITLELNKLLWNSFSRASLHTIQVRERFLKVHFYQIISIVDHDWLQSL